jgi:hypothetical protein
MKRATSVMVSVIGSLAGCAPNAPTSSGVALGTACRSAADCGGAPALCLTSRRVSFCSSPCQTSADCGPGGVCIRDLVDNGNGTSSNGCLAGCAQAGDCPQSGTLVCSPLVAGGGACFPACTTNADCATGATCIAATGLCASAPPSVDGGVPPPTPDLAMGGGSGCAYSHCPPSMYCSSPTGSHGTYQLVCHDIVPLIDGMTTPATCFEHEGTFDTSPTFPPPYTCQVGGQLTCNWPSGSVSCPVMWMTPSSCGGMAVVAGCCGILVSNETAPRCGVIGLGATGYSCGEPGPNDVPVQ